MSKVISRLYAKGTWTLESPAHFGGEDVGFADMCLIRDEKGRPFIPGSSIAGSARSYLAQSLHPWGEYKEGKESPTLKRLFGSDKNDGMMSCLFVFDAPLDKDKGTAVRDGVRIDNEKGVASDGAKFDLEVMECGSTFKLHFECVLYEGDNRDELEDLFYTLLLGFEKGNIHLGARTRRGYGRGKVNELEVRHLKMDNPQDVIAWLKGEDAIWERPEKKDWRWSQFGKGEDVLTLNDHRNFFRIEAQCYLKTSLLIRSMPDLLNATDNDPDVVHLYSNGKPTLPGTSLAGVLRHRAQLIGKTLGTWEEKNIEEIFGPLHSDSDKEKKLWASRIYVEEYPVSNVASKIQSRIAIDRFTGGALEGALFQEKPVFHENNIPHIQINLTLEEPEEEEMGLLLLVLRDLWSGDVALGGGVSNGRGTLQGGEATIVSQKETKATTCKLTMNNGKIAIVEGKEDILGWVQKAHKPPDKVRGSRCPKEGQL